MSSASSNDNRPDWLADHYAHCEALLKEQDRTAWLACLFAPADRRPSLHALEAFVLDVAGVRAKVRETLAGELRLQWWADAIEGETRGDVKGHPVAAALLDTVARHKLSRSALTGFVDVRRDDLYDEPIPTLAAFDERADRTEGALFALRARVLTDRDEPSVADAARHAGRLVAVADAMLALSRQRVLVPLDILQAHGIGTAELAAASTAPGVAAALKDFAAHASRERVALRKLRSTIPPGAGPAFLMTNLAEPRVRRFLKQPFAAEPSDLPLWRRQWILWRAAGRNGVL